MSQWQLEQPIRSLAANIQGRDFVVGDLHGSLSLLERSLQQLEFNPEFDRLISVGDLIDRGEASAAMIDWLHYPWFYACIGNHEAVLLDYLSSGDEKLAETWQRFGGAWFFELNEQQQLDALRLIQSRTHFAIEILSPSGEAATGIVHADVPYQLSWQAFKQALCEEDDVRYHAIWSRDRGRGDAQVPVAGIESVICGHEIVAKAHKRANVWLIDTGAYRAASGQGKLTILELPERLHEFG